MLMDGFPTGGYIFGIIAEFVLGSYSIFQLKIQSEPILLKASMLQLVMVGH
jgi:hypothetical protein